MTASADGLFRGVLHAFAGACDQSIELSGILRHDEPAFRRGEFLILIPHFHLLGLLGRQFRFVERYRQFMNRDARRTLTFCFCK
jgi:hypothetical protein